MTGINGRAACVGKSVQAAQIDCGKRMLRLDQGTLLMGILNVTPDSFSDGGRYVNVDEAVAFARQMIADGADLLDIGGESTRPGAEPVSLEVELARVIPVILSLRDAGIDVPISVDTYKAEVARQALEAGADLVNDVWGMRRDVAMAEVAIAKRCPIVLMHNREGETSTYTDVINEVVRDLEQSVEHALKIGVKPEHIILDPGIGFAKTLQHNLTLMTGLWRIVDLGFPVLLGTSRKSMIRHTLGLPADDVIEGTAATVVAGIWQGCHLMRVHDVREMKRVVRMTDAMVQAR